MNIRLVIGLMFSCLIVSGELAGSSSHAASIRSISPSQLDLVRGGKPQPVVISGSDLARVKVVGLMTSRGFRAAEGLSVKVGASRKGTRVISVWASSSARVGQHKVQLYLNGGPGGTMQINVVESGGPKTLRSKRIKEIPPMTVVIEAERIKGGPIGVVERERVERTPTMEELNLPQVTQSHLCDFDSENLPPPNVTAATPSPKGMRGTILKFHGRDLVQENFCAKIGNRYLEIVSRADDLIEAKLPDVLMTGPLYVSHGSDTNEWALEPTYTVFGEPAISGISATEIWQGDIVTLYGTDLDALEDEFFQSGYEKQIVKVSNSTSNAGSDFVYASEFHVNEDGTEATFRVGHAYEGSINSKPLSKIDPQPQTLTGKLRFGYLKSDSSNVAQYVVIGPEVVWRPMNELQITEAYPASGGWGDAVANFIILKGATDENIVWVEGTNLHSADFKLGDLQLFPLIPDHGRSGGIPLPSHASSGTLRAQKNGQTSYSPYPLITLKPSFVNNQLNLNNSTGVWDVKLGQEILMQGWDLSGASVDGLEFVFRMSGLPHASCNLELNIIEHTDYLIKIIVHQTDPLPDSCLNTTLFGSTPGSYNVAQLKAIYNNVEREVWRKPFMIVP